MHEEYTLILVDGKRVSPSKGLDKQGYNSSAGFIPPLSMIERVEVIKGPASLRYGSEAMGGVINIITKKTPDKTTASVSLDARLQEHHANWGNTYNFNGSIYHPINEMFAINLRGKVSYNEENHIYAAAQDASGNRYGPGNYTCVPNTGYSGTNNQGTKCGNPYIMFAPSAYQNASVGGRITFTPDEQNTIYLDTGFDFQRIGTLATSPRQMGETRDYERFNVLLSHDGKYDFGDISTYLQYNVISQITHFYKYYDTERLNRNINQGRDHSSLLYNPTISGASTFTKNLDLGGAGALIVNAGPSFFYERSYNRDGGLDDDGYQIAVFGEGEYLPLDWLGVVAGVRVNYANDFGVYAAPRAYLSFYPMSWLTLKAGFAGGFQVPDLKMRHIGYYEYSESPNTTYYGNKDLKMEKSYNYEVSALVDTPFANFTLAGFITDYNNWLTSTTVANGSPMLDTVCEVKHSGDTQCLYYYNVGDAQLWGAELGIGSKAILSSLFAKWNGGIFVDISYAYTDTEQKSGSDKGKPLNNVPLHSVMTKLSYKTPNWELYAKYRGTLKRSVTTTASAGYEQNIPKFYKDLHMVDLGTSYRFSNGITLGFVVNNLLDIDTTKDFYMWRQNFSQPLYSTMLPGRNYWISVSADF